MAGGRLSEAEVGGPHCQPGSHDEPFLGTGGVTYVSQGRLALYRLCPAPTQGTMGSPQGAPGDLKGTPALQMKGVSGIPRPLVRDPDPPLSPSPPTEVQPWSSAHPPHTNPSLPPGSPHEDSKQVLPHYYSFAVYF